MISVELREGRILDKKAGNFDYGSIDVEDHITVLELVNTVPGFLVEITCSVNGEDVTYQAENIPQLENSLNVTSYRETDRLFDASEIVYPAVSHLQEIDYNNKLLSEMEDKGAGTL